MGKDEEVGQSSQYENVPPRFFIWLAVLLPAVSILVGCADRPAYEMSPKLKSEIDPLYKDFRTGVFLHTTYVPIMGNPVKVFVVDEPRGAQYGFVQVDHEMSQFWIVDPGRYKVRRYNSTHLFIAIDEAFALELQRRGYGPPVPSTSELSKPDEAHGSGIVP